MIKRIWKKYRKPIYALCVVGLIWFYFCLPKPLFSDPYSTVVNDRTGQLIGAKIASDGQWRFPQVDAVPKTFEDAIITFEDSRFRYHLGVDPISITRAIVQNVEAGSVQSGASTISMQVIRMSRKGKPRSIWQKMVEMILATRLELRYSKKEILRMHASHAPFGGNVVGLEAASWRYFHKSSHLLSTAEAAMLAVLPNAPSLIHINRNRDALLAKRNRLLKKMMDEELISEEDYQLSILEPIPAKPYALPSIAPHFVEYVHTKLPQQITESTVSSDVQNMLFQVADFHHRQYAQSDIHNMAILVLDTETGEVLGYAGNAPNTSQEKSVDMIQARRSSGSVLKPLLHAHLIDRGQLMPHALIKDIPIQISGFRPKNYIRKYSGATPADQALAMSLNIPAVSNLQLYGVEPFLKRLHQHGFSSMTRSADHYGLSLILGGGEVSLWELCRAYRNMGSTLIDYQKHGKYDHSEEASFSFRKSKPVPAKLELEPKVLSAGSIYQTFLAMTKVMRPGADGQWQQFDSSQPIAWKTGTSYGHRDAWAIGVSPKFTVGVWVGNADGEPKNGLVGVSKGGPVLFDVYNRLESAPFFAEPVDDLVPTLSCHHSGFLASQYCDQIDTIYSVAASQSSPTCPYHRLIHTNAEGQQVTSMCSSPSEMTHTSWFELPPAMAHYYRQNHPSYQSPPPYRVDCLTDADRSVLSFIYPTAATSIYLPINQDGIQEKAVFKAAHQDPKAILYWHIDEEYLGYTSEFHDMAISASQGNHTVTIVDQMGNRSVQKFEVLR